MKKLSRFWGRIPRPLRTLIHLVTTLLCLMLLYWAAGSPAFTVEMEYRQLERSYMVGPCTILGTETVPGNDQQKVMIGKDDTHLMVCPYTVGNKLKHYSPTFREKHGSLTLLAAWDIGTLHSTDNNFVLPVILFDEYPEAVRAEVAFTMYAPEDQSSNGYKKDFFLESTRTNDGYFFFTIEHKAYTNQLYTQVLRAIGYISSGFNYDESLAAITPISVRLYDVNDQLIVDEIIYFRTATADSKRP